MKGLSEIVRVAGLEQETGLAVLQHFRHAAGARGDDGFRAGLRFEQAFRRDLVTDRWQNDGVRRLDMRPERRAFAIARKGGAHALFARARLEIGAARAVADDHEIDAALGGGVDQDMHAFFR